jgi:hypothetical protein
VRWEGDEMKRKKLGIRLMMVMMLMIEEEEEEEEEEEKWWFVGVGGR